MRDRAAECEGKTRFDSFAAAERVAHGRWGKKKPLHPYRCLHCQGFHLGDRLGKRHSRRER